MRKEKVFTELGVCQVTDSTRLVLSSCSESGVFKGFYLSKQYSVKDSNNPDKEVMVFAKGSFRIDSLSQLESLKNVIENGIKKIQQEEN